MAEENKQEPRGAYDLTMRHLAQDFPDDFALLILGRKPDMLEVLSSDLPATEKRADWAVEAASKVKDNIYRSNILTAIAVLGSLRYSKELIFSFIRSEAMKESSIVQEFIREGLERGRQEGLVKGELIGEIRASQRFLKRSVTPQTDLEQKTVEELRAIAADLDKRIDGNGS